MNERRLEIDTLRGLACILLVAYHVVGGTKYSGLLIDGGWLREINDYLAYLRMPLFTVLSGYVYASRPFAGDGLGFVAGKARRLLVPMLFVGTTFAIMQELVPGANTTIDNWYLLHIVPVAHFWFVESLFIIFLVIMPLEKFGLLSSMPAFLVVFAICTVIYLFFPITKFFSISGATYLLPYFLFGLWCARYKVIDSAPKAWIGITAVSLLGAIALLEGNDVSKRSLPAIVVGILACSLLLGSKIKIGFLARIGVYSYTIYLLHIFFTAASRIILGRIGVDSIPVLFLVGCVFGLLGPVVMEMIFGRFHYFKLFVSGQSLKSKNRPSASLAR